MLNGLTLPTAVIDLASYFIAVPMVIAILRFRHLNEAMKSIAVYVLLSLLIQVYSTYLSSQKENNLFVLHIYTPLEFACIVWFFSIVLQGFLPKKLFIWMATGFAILSLLNTAFIQDSKTFNTYARSLEGVLVIAMCLIWCYRTLSEMKIQRLEHEPSFWVNTGFLLYFSGSVLLFAFSNYILDINRSLNLYIWAFHALFSILVYFFIAVGLWKAR